MSVLRQMEPPINVTMTLHILYVAPWLVLGLLVVGLLNVGPNKLRHKAVARCACLFTPSGPGWVPHLGRGEGIVSDEEREGTVNVGSHWFSSSSGAMTHI